MSVFRKVSVTAWSDPWFFQLKPKEKLTWLFLITGQSTTACGAYQLNTDLCAMLLGVSKDEMMTTIKRFTKDGKIAFDESTEELFIFKWPKYNGSKSPKTLSAVRSSLSEIKSEDIFNISKAVWIEYGYSIDTVYKQENTVSIPLKTSTHEKENEKEKEKENENPPHIYYTLDSITREVLQTYQQEMGLMSPINQQDLEAWVKDFYERVKDAKDAGDIVSEAIHVASSNNKRSLSYVEAILKRYWTQNIANGDQAKKSNDEFSGKPSKPDYVQRNHKNTQGGVIDVRKELSGGK